MFSGAAADSVETRSIHAEGLTGYGPPSLALGAGVAAGIASLLVASPVWFVSFCLLSARVRWWEVESCAPFPPLGAAGWTLAFMVAVGFGASYALFYRWSIRNALYVFLPGVRINAANLYAIVLGHILALTAAVGLGDPRIAGFEWVAILISGPLLARVWWGACNRWMQFMAERDAKRASIAAIQYLLYQTFSFRRSQSLRVTLSDHGIHVAGPVDAVDEKRIRDIVLRYAQDRRLGVKVESTLSEDEYLLPYTRELGPSGRASRPIRRTDLIDSKWVVLAIALPLLLWLAFWWAVGFKVETLDDLAEGIRDMFEMHGIGPEEGFSPQD